MPRASAFKEGDEALLKARLVEYRSTPSGEKEAFRDACAKYILRSRQLDETDELLIELFSAKVRNWFQNNTERVGKDTRLPLRINQGFSARRIFGHKNRDLIRSTLAKANEGKTPDSRTYLVQWNETVQRMWDALSTAEQRPYFQLAELWAVQGPDAEMKPLLAERRSGAWFRAVSHLFWSQCGMPVFIYGMFKDSNGKMRATVYDTTELWAEDKPSTPKFRGIKDWDLNFRRTAWSFFGAVLDPEHASQDTIAMVQATRRPPAAPVVFERYPDGTPIMPNDPEGNAKKPPTTLRRQRILREYLRIHYSYASGREVRSVPWKSIRDTPDKFFADGMLPPNFVLGDPSKVPELDLTKFSSHVYKMENRADSQPSRFRFTAYEVGPKENRSYPPAVYSGTLEPAAPRRVKRVGAAPEFDGSPSDDETDDGHVPTTTSTTPVPASLPGPSRFSLALEAGFAKVQASIAAEAARSAPSTPPAEPLVLPADKGKEKATEPWVEAELHAALSAAAEMTDGDDDVGDVTWVMAAVNDHEEPNDLAFGSDDEVEDVLDFVPMPAGEEQDDDSSETAETFTLLDIAIPPDMANAGDVVPDMLPSGRRPLQSPATPQSVGRNGEARFRYLSGLASDVVYHDMLKAFEPKICEIVTLRGKSPVLWGTWGLASAHVPESIQTSEANVATLLKWVGKGLPTAATPAEIQRFCLVVGLMLSDLEFLDDTTSPWPEGLPGFLSYSELHSSHRDVVLAACQSVVDTHTSSATTESSPPPPTPAQPTRTGSGRGAGDASDTTGTSRGVAPPAAGGRRTRSKARQG